MNTRPKAGEVWFADLGMIEKGRPVLVLYYPEPKDVSFGCHVRMDMPLKSKKRAVVLSWLGPPLGFAP